MALLEREPSPNIQLCCTNGESVAVAGVNFIVLLFKNAKSNAALHMVLVCAELFNWNKEMDKSKSVINFFISQV
jgi:hypothetical protein